MRLFPIARDLINLPRFCGARILALILFLTPTAPAFAQQSSYGPCFWHSNTAAIRQLDGSSGRLLAEINSPSRNLHMNGVDCGIWFFKPQELKLLHYDSSGALIHSIRLENLDPALDGVDIFTVDGVDESLWVLRGTTIVHAGSKGKLLGKLSLSDPPTILKIGLDQKLWAILQDQLIAIGPDHQVVSQILLPSSLGPPMGLAVDSLRDKLWIAGKNKIVRLNTKSLDTSVKNVATLAEDITSLTLDAELGEVWIATANTIHIYSPDGTQFGTIDLAPNQLSGARISYDPLTKQVFAQTNTAIATLGRTGAVGAKWLTASPVGDLAVAAFRVTPNASIKQPSSGAYISNPNTELQIKYSAFCNGQTCTLPSSYRNGFSLTAELNGKFISSRFTKNSTIGGVSYLPSEPLPEGPNTFTALVKDRFGQKSEKQEPNFSVDTVSPQFIAISPPDSSVQQQASVRVQGEISEQAIVTFDNKDEFNAQGSNPQGSPFSWTATLQPGANLLKFSATDFAGNATTQTLQLMLGAYVIDFNISSPTNGATINNDHVLVKGGLSTSGVVGVTINGMPATFSGNKFEAVIPLVAGENVITVTATAPSGAQSTKKRKVNAVIPAFTIAVSPNPAMAGAQTQFSAIYPAPISLIEADYDGDSTIDQSESDPAAQLRYIYSAPGRYTAKFKAHSTSGQITEKNVTVVVEGFSGADGQIQRVYQDMLNRLRVGDIAGAKTFFTPSGAEKYELVFRALDSNLNSAANRLGELSKGMIGRELAEYVIVRYTPQGQRSFLIYFLRDGNGVWRIDSM